MSLLAPISRTLVDEQMDSPTLPEAAHRKALAGLRRINRVSRTAASLLPPIIEYARRKNLKRLRLLDVASGGGDVPVKLCLLARRAGLTIDLALFDRSATALRIAQETARRFEISTEIISGDATRDVPRNSFDIVTNSLFLHHLTEADTIAALAGMRDAGSGMVLVSDLRRSRHGVAMAHLACRVLSRSPVVHFDGPASVRAAWTQNELKGFAERAGLIGAKVTKQWPGRMFLRWERE